MTTGQEGGEGKAEALARRLAALGLVGTVEARGKLAVLALHDLRAVREPGVRAAAVAAAAEHGFTTLALELGDDADDGEDRAPLSRD